MDNTQLKKLAERIGNAAECGRRTSPLKAIEHELVAAEVPMPRGVNTRAMAKLILDTIIDQPHTSEYDMARRGAYLVLAEI